MRSGVAVGRWVAALIASLLMLLVGPAASASGAATVRFVQAIPGSGAGFQLQATEGGITQKVGEPAGFGDVGGYAQVPAGAVTFELRARGDRRLATAKERISNGARYTVVAMGTGADRLVVLRDGAGQAGSSRLRVVHAAPELGAVDVRLGDRVVADSIDFAGVAGYTAVEPGAYAVRVTRPDDASVLAARGGVPLTAGTSSTAFVIGSGGEPLRVVVATDRSTAPRRAPETGLGGLAGDDSRLLLALLAGLLAAAGGGAAYVALTGGSRRGGS